MKVSDITCLNEKGQAYDLYTSIPKVIANGPYPQYNFNSTSKSSKDICGYTISYSNEIVNKLFRKFEKKITKKFKRLIIKPVFSKNKKGVKTAYFKVQMNGSEILCRYFYTILFR